MKTILVTGCNGQLGRAINEKYLQNRDIELVNTDVAELDITNIDEVIAMVDKIRPYAIINCAAHTAVDKCETDVDNAYRINAIGPRNLSIAASKYDAKICHISTDYVFDGTLDRKYIEFDAPNPQGVYGKTKLAGEEFVRQFANKHFILRTAWLYGDGKNFVKTMLRLSETNNVVRIVGDQVGSPTSTDVLVDIIDNLIFTENYGTFHATCSGKCSWAEFAERIFKLAGKDVKVEYISTDEYNAPAKRPANSVLDNMMLRLTVNYIPNSWEVEIEKYISKIGGVV